uniref:DENN domain containing 2C n=1 Tax=Fundulus heteroclitus TaxID=8078 RepID=A0A3Q2QJE5_FUNHE
LLDLTTPDPVALFAATVRQAWQPGRPVSHQQRVNIKEKISQWEIWCQQSSSQEAGVKAHPPGMSRTLSGDLLGSGCSHKSLGVAKDSRSRAKSTELDFRDSPAHVGRGVAGRKSEPLRTPCGPFSAASPGENGTAQTFGSSTSEVDNLLSADPVFTASADSKGERVPDLLIASKPLPPLPADQEDIMPAGNFYTSRGFWRKLEGDRLLWENSRSSAGEAQPPPKPQRTFLYRGTNNNTKQWDSASPHNNHSNLRSRRVRQPPNFPPPPCPEIRIEGLPVFLTEVKACIDKLRQQHLCKAVTYTVICTSLQYISKIETIFDDKRGRKRVKNQGPLARGKTQKHKPFQKVPKVRSVYIQSTLRRRPGYRTLERDLIQLQQQKQQLFQIFVVVSLRKDFTGNAYSPEITQQFPKLFEKSSRPSREVEDQLNVIPKFCFPDPQDWKPSAHVPSETFSFVLTGEDGSRWFCYCRKILPSGKGKRLPEVHCIVSKLGCFNLFAKILEEVERRREISPPLVNPFMRSVMEAPFPAPGRTVAIKSFLPGSGNEVLTLCRPVDSRLEHVDFGSLLQCLSVGRLLQVFASLLLERRVIFVADKLSVLSRCGHAALALLYPFIWQHTFVPVLPATMLDISCSPTPFLIGVLAPCLPELLELPIEEVLIVDLCADRFVRQLGDEDCILPSKLQAALQQILEDREDILRQHNGDTCADLSSLLSEGFVHFFVELVGHYPLYMAEAANGTKELQRESFRKSHPSRGVRQFLQLFMDTQMFAGFIQDKELRKGGGKGAVSERGTYFLGWELGHLNMSPSKALPKMKTLQ